MRATPFSGHILNHPKFGNNSASEINQILKSIHFSDNRIAFTVVVQISLLNNFLFLIDQLHSYTLKSLKASWWSSNDKGTELIHC